MNLIPEENFYLKTKTSISQALKYIRIHIRENQAPDKFREFELSEEEITTKRFKFVYKDVASRGYHPVLKVAGVFKESKTGSIIIVKISSSKSSFLGLLLFILPIFAIIFYAIFFNLVVMIFAVMPIAMMVAFWLIFRSIFYDDVRKVRGLLKVWITDTGQITTSIAERKQRRKNVYVLELFGTSIFVIGFVISFFDISSSLWLNNIVLVLVVLYLVIVLGIRLYLSFPLMRELKSPFSRSFLSSIGILLIIMMSIMFGLLIVSFVLQ